MSLIVSLIEMVTISTTGWIGFVMNVIASALFVCPAAWIYHRRRTVRGALIGLLVGAVAMTGGMILWNYIITPLYMLRTTSSLLRYLARPAAISISIP